MKINCLRQLALGEVSACGRNWYLTEALCEEGLVIKPTEKQTKQRIYSGSLHDLFLLLSVMLDLEKTIDVVETAYFHFTDVDSIFIFKVCNIEFSCIKKEVMNYEIFFWAFDTLYQK